MSAFHRRSLPDCGGPETQKPPLDAASRRYRATLRGDADRGLLKHQEGLSSEEVAPADRVPGLDLQFLYQHANEELLLCPGQVPKEVIAFHGLNSFERFWTISLHFCTNSVPESCSRRDAKRA